MAIIQGHFAGRVFSAWENAYHVYQFKTDTDRTVNVIYRENTTPPINGPDYVLQGRWGQSGRYGWQFYINSMEPAESYTERHAAKMQELKQMVLV